MTPHTDWERFTVPSNHVWSVKKDETTGGYEAIVDIKRPVEMAISHAVAEERERIIRILTKQETDMLLKVTDRYERRIITMYFHQVFDSLTPPITEEKENL